MTSQQFIDGLGAVVNREWVRIKGRPFYVVISIVAMVFCSVFFLTLMKEGLPNHLPIAVVDLDNSSLSRTYIRNLEVTQQSAIKARCSNYEEALDLLQRGKVYAFVIVPRNFQANALGGHAPEITYYITDGYLIGGSLLLKDLTYMNVLTSAAIQQKILIAKGFTEEQTMGIIQPIAIDNHMIGNPWANYGIYLVNVLLPGVLQLFVLMLTIFALGIELKEKTAKQWLASANGSLLGAVVGKLFPYTILFSALGICCNIVLYKFMHFPMHGSFGVMCMTSIMYVLATQAVGVLIVGLLPNMRQGISLGAFYGLLGFSYAGFSFPIEGMPVGAQIFSALFPIRYYFRIYVNEALLGINISHSFIYFAILIAFLLLPAIVWIRIKKAIEYS